MSIDEILSRDECFRYQLLDRMKQDCIYYLNGHRAKGNHWANQWHSKFHKDGTPLLRNGSQGKLPAPSNKGACPVQTPQMSSSTTPASNNGQDSMLRHGIIPSNPRKHSL